MDQLPSIVGVNPKKHASQASHTGILACLSDSDWSTRKAASTALLVIGEIIGADAPDLLRHCMIKGLEAARFDKARQP